MELNITRIHDRFKLVNVHKGQCDLEGYRADHFNVDKSRQVVASKLVKHARAMQ